MPGQQSLRCYDGLNFCQDLPTKLLCRGCKTPTPAVTESHPPFAHLLSKNAVLLDQIFNNVVLMRRFIQPAIMTTSSENGSKPARIAAAYHARCRPYGTETRTTCFERSRNAAFRTSVREFLRLADAPSAFCRNLETDGAPEIGESRLAARDRFLQQVIRSLYGLSDLCTNILKIGNCNKLQHSCGNASSMLPKNSTNHYS